MNSTELNLLAEALAKAQGEIRPAIKTRVAKIYGDKAKYEYRYADLADCWEVIREPLSKNGLAVVQMPRVADGKITMTTMLLHASGQYISDDLNVDYSYGDLRSLGSAISYLRRFHLSAIVGLVSEIDDDADHNSTESPPPPQHHAPVPTEDYAKQLDELKASLASCPDADTMENRYKSVYRQVYGWRNNELLGKLVSFRNELKDKYGEAK